LVGVTSINVSDIEPDPITNMYVRRLEVYIDSPDAQNRRPSLTIVVNSPDKQSVAITIPSGVTF